MYLLFNGLNVDSSPYVVTVAPAALTVATTSTIVNINSLLFTTGQSIQFVIESRDAYGNLRTSSTSDVYTITLTGILLANVINAATPVANNNGTYTASY